MCCLCGIDTMACPEAITKPISNNTNECVPLTLSFRLGPLGDITERISKIYDDGIRQIEALTQQTI